MSLPDIPMRTWRVSSALALATLLITLPLAQPPDEHTTATPTASATHSVQADPPPPVLHIAASTTQRTAAALRHQATAAPPKAPEPPRRAKPATRPMPRPTPTATVTAPRAARSSPRPVLAPAAPTLTGAQSYARSRVGSAQYSCLSSIVQRESGWNPRAQNPASGAYGLFQALPGSKMASAGSDWRSNPLTQMRWGISYMQQRYGTPCGAWNFWQKNGWY